MVRLGEILILRGRPDEAREWLEAAARTNPKSVEAAFLAGYLYWEGGNLEAAARFFENALRAAHADVPTRGVLNEGDRQPAHRGRGQAPAPSPPLQGPMGQTLLGEFSEPLKTTRTSAGNAFPFMTALYRALREAKPRLMRESEPAAQSRSTVR